MNRTRSGPVALRPLTAAVLFIVLPVACTGGGGTLVAPPSRAPSVPAPKSPPPAVVIPKELCQHAKPIPLPTGTASGPLPAPIQRVAGQVEGLRGIRFQHPVSPEAIGHEKLVSLLRSSLEQEFPAGMEARREQAWIAMGAIPPGTDLRQAYFDYAGTQVIGFYDTLSHRLVFQGSSNPTPYQRMTLAHELTHALDDQAFGLGLLDRLVSSCQDEELLAFQSLAEGDAVETQLRWAQQDLTVAEQLRLSQEAASFSPPPASVPPFVKNLLVFPYTSGRLFVQALMARGGQRAVNDAFRNPPLSTEQIIHPERYPNDVPARVPVPELKEKLGGPWQDLDMEPVGEAWLQTLLQLRVPSEVAYRAAAGWDGGLYRAWSLGPRTAVLMKTMWDTERDAVDFARTMATYGQGSLVSVRRIGQEVDVLFGTDPVALEDLKRATG